MYHLIIVSQLLLAFYLDLQHFGIHAYPIINMQVIETVRQAGYVEFNRAAFGFLLPQQIAPTVVEADVVGRRNPEDITADE